MRDLLTLPRKRNLPEIWKTRLALEGVAPGNLRLKGYNCAVEWPVGPAMTAFDEGEKAIYKAAAFPRCILFPEHGTSSNASAKRRCVNAHYRESKAESIPPVWSPPASTTAPVYPPMLPSALSPPSAQSYFPAPAESYSPGYSPPHASTPFNMVERAMPSTLFPETPSRRSIHDEPTQQQTGSLTSTQNPCTSTDRETVL